MGQSQGAVGSKFVRELCINPRNVLEHAVASLKGLESLEIGVLGWAKKMVPSITLSPMQVSPMKQSGSVGLVVSGLQKNWGAGAVSKPQTSGLLFAGSRGLF